MGHPDSWNESRSSVTLQLTERHANCDLQATQVERDSVRERKRKTEGKRHSEIKTSARLCETNQETKRNIKGEEESISETHKRRQRYQEKRGKESFRKGGRRAETPGRNQNSKEGKFLKQ